MKRPTGNAPPYFTDDHAPTFACHEVTDGGGRMLWAFDCPECGTLHYHGPRPGHRIAHCAAGPLTVTGYNVVGPDGCQN